MKDEMKTKMSRMIGKITFGFKKHSPEILIVAGVIGVVTSAVLACKATTKVSEILDDAAEDVDKVHRVLNDETKSQEYSEEDARKDLTLIYIKTGFRFVTLYAPSVLLGVVSLTSIVASNRILKKRNVALAAAYATVDESFKKYRQRLIERYGEATDKELKYGLKAATFEETVTDKDGNQTKATTTVQVADEPNDFARFFDDEHSDAWERNDDYNLMFLRSEQSFANDKLISRGYLFLNEVYERLGFKPTKAGQIVGWIYNPENNPEGDNYVDFGITDLYRKSDSGDGYEETILLNFNVDGPILDKVEANAR